MILGILADSHGDACTTARAVDLLRDNGAELLIHLGDVETSDVIGALSVMPARLVFGNCDYDLKTLATAAKRAGVVVDHPIGRLEFDGRTVAYTHGDVERLMKQAIEDGVEYLLHGHWHVTRDDRFAGTRIINPGALHRAARYTAAVLDPGNDRLRFLNVPRR